MKYSQVSALVDAENFLYGKPTDDEPLPRDLADRLILALREVSDALEEREADVKRLATAIQPSHLHFPSVSDLLRNTPETNRDYDNWKSLLALAEEFKEWVDDGEEVVAHAQREQVKRG